MSASCLRVVLRLQVNACSTANPAWTSLPMCIRSARLPVAVKTEKSSRACAAFATPKDRFCPEQSSPSRCHTCSAERPPYAGPPLLDDPVECKNVGCSQGTSRSAWHRGPPIPSFAVACGAWHSSQCGLRIRVPSPACPVRAGACVLEIQDQIGLTSLLGKEAGVATLCHVKATQLATHKN